MGGLGHAKRWLSNAMYGLVLFFKSPTDESVKIEVPPIESTDVIVDIIQENEDNISSDSSAQEW